MDRNTVKQVIVIRTDLNMRKGKAIAQGAHASMGALVNNSYRQESGLYSNGLLTMPLDDDLHRWLTDSYTKITLRVGSEEELLELRDKVVEKDMRHFLVLDNGTTEFHNNPTYTALAIGPAKNTEIDKITGHLELL